MAFTSPDPSTGFRDIRQVLIPYFSYSTLMVSLTSSSPCADVSMRRFPISAGGFPMSWSSSTPRRVSLIVAGLYEERIDRSTSGSRESRCTIT